MQQKSLNTLKDTKKKKKKLSLSTEEITCYSQIFKVLLYQIIHFAPKNIPSTAKNA